LPAHTTLYAGVAAAALLIWLFPIAIERAAHVKHQGAAISVVQIGTIPMINTDEMAVRPLFMAGRRPLPVAQAPKPRSPQVAVVPAAPPTANGIVLLGTMLSAGRRLALIRSPASPTTTLLAPGEAIGPWTIDDITLDRVRLRTGTQIVDLKFSSTGSSAPSPPAGLPMPAWMAPGRNAFAPPPVSR